MKIKALLILFLILLLPFSALASDGNGEEGVKVIGTDGKTISGAIEKSENFSSASHENVTPTADLSSTTITKTGMQAGQEMIENSGKELFFWVGDQFGKGGFELASIGVEEKNVTGAQTPRYTLYSKELKPFESPAVRTFVLICVLFHIAVVLIFIFSGVTIYNIQKVAPKEVSKIRAGFSGEESYFDIKSYMFVCCSVLVMPFVDYFGIWYELLNRNVLVSAMTTKMVDVLGVASDNLPTYLLVNLAWYINMFEKLSGEFAIHLMCACLVLKSWIMAVILLFGSLKQASILQFSVMISFTLVLLMDLITLGLVYFGVNLSVSENNWGYILVGMSLAVLIDAAILYSVYKGFKFLLTYRFRNRVGGY